MRSQRGNPPTRPAIAMACHQSIPVQDPGDTIIIGNQHQVTKRGNQIG
jgi:hypothetical protein